jgi:hypothetical protein
LAAFKRKYCFVTLLKLIFSNWNSVVGESIGKHFAPVFKQDKRAHSGCCKVGVSKRIGRIDRGKRETVEGVWWFHCKDGHQSPPLTKGLAKAT